METTKHYGKNLPEIQIKYKRGNFEKTRISTSGDAAEVFKKVFNSDTIEYTEEVIILYLNSAHKTIGWVKHSSGGMVSSVVDVRTVLSTALICGASALIIAHNHPSGQLFPSEEDKRFTKRISEAGKTLSISVLDHVILAGDDYGYFSFADEGLL